MKFDILVDYNFNRRVYGFLVFFYAFMYVMFNGTKPVLVYLATALMLGYFLLNVISNKNEVIVMATEHFIFFLFILYCIFTAMFGTHISNSIGKIMTLVQLWILYIALYNALYKYKVEFYLFNGLIIGVEINYLIYLEIFPWDKKAAYAGTSTRFQGTTYNPNDLGRLTVISIIMSFVYIKVYAVKGYYLLLNSIHVVVGLLVIVATQSRKALLATAIIIFSFVVMQSKFIKVRHLGYFYLTILFLIFFTPALLKFIDVPKEDLEQFERFGKRLSYAIDSIGGDKEVKKAKSIQHRKELIHLAMMTFNANPIMGVGIDNFRFVEGHYAHNNYVELLANVGIIGFLLFYSVYIFLSIRIFFSEYKEILIMVVFILLIYDVFIVSYGAKDILMFITLTSYLACKSSTKNLVLFGGRRYIK